MDISKEAIEKIKELNEISFKLHGGKKEVMEYLLKSIKDHAEEINEMLLKNNEHWKIETGDLMIQCMRILNLYDIDMNDMFDKCSFRVESKITKLLNER